MPDSVISFFLSIFISIKCFQTIINAIFQHSGFGFRLVCDLCDEIFVTEYCLSVPFELDLIWVGKLDLYVA